MSGTTVFVQAPGYEALNTLEAQAVAMRIGTPVAGKNPTTEGGGATLKATMAATGLNHSQAERAIMKVTIVPTILFAGYLGLGDTPEARVQAARKLGLSWGPIAIAEGVSENRARTYFTTATGLKSQGQRIGRGGRFYYGEAGAPLYEGELRPSGTAIPVGAKREQALQLSRYQRLTLMAPEALTAFAAELGLERAKGQKRTAFVALVAEAAEALNAR